MPTHVQSTGTTGATGHGVTSISKSFATPNVDGNLIVVDGAGWNSVGPPGVSTVDDNAGSATYQQGIHMENVNTTLATYYQTNVASANPFTVTITWLNAANCSISAHEYSSAGAKTASNLAGGTGQSVASGSVAPAGTNLYHGVGCYVTGSSQSFTLTWGGATERGNYDSTNAEQQHSAADIVTGSGTQNATWTIGTSQSWCAGITAFADTGPAAWLPRRGSFGQDARLRR